VQLSAIAEGALLGSYRYEPISAGPPKGNKIDAITVIHTGEAKGAAIASSAQTVVQVCTIVLAGVAAVVPRKKGPLELAALTASLLLAFELSLTHWFYLYLPWVLPFVLLALFLPREPRPDEALPA